MSAPLTTALILLAGFCLYSAIHSLFNAYYLPRHRMHLYFALMCIFLTFYIFTRLSALHSHVAPELVSAQRWGFVASLSLFICQIGFISEYASWRPRWFIIPLIGALLVVMIINLLLPYSAGYTSLPDLQQIHLPWGEIITDTWIHVKSIWWLLGALMILVVFGFQFIAAFRLKKSDQQKQGNALLWFGAIPFMGVLFNMLNNFYYAVHFTQIAEFSFIAMIILMNLYLNWDTRATYQRAESAESMWSSIVMNAPNFIVVLDTNSNIQFMNQVLPGDKLEDIVGTHVDNYLQPDSQVEMHESLKKVIATKKAVSTQLQLGEPRNIWVDAQLAPLFVGEKLEHFIVLATDISEQIATKQKLEFSESRYRQLLNTIAYGIQEIDREGKITYSNPAHDQLFGYAPGDMLGMSIFDLVAGEQEQHKLRNFIHLIFDAQTTPQTYYTKIKLHGGGTRELKVDWDYKYDEQSNVIGVISILSDITQQLKAEESLRDSEEKFRQLAENIDIVFYIRDLKSNRMLYISPTYEKIWGRSASDLYRIPDDFFQSIHPEDKARVLALFKQEDRENRFFDIEYRMIDAHGITHWINSRRYPIKDAYGDIHRIAGIVEDITQRKQIDENLKARTVELQQSRDFISAVIDTIGAVILVMDKTGVIVRFNHACEYISGYNADEAIGRKAWDFLILPEERESVKNIFSKLTIGNFPNHYENYWLHKNGSKRLIAWSNTCLIDKDNNVEFVLATGVDISEQRSAEAALRDSAEKYRTLIEYASDIILVSDLEGWFIDCNSSALRVLGYTREELLRLRVPDIHPTELRTHHLSEFHTLIETGSVVTNDAALLCKDGQIVPVDINANIIEYHGSKVAVGFMRDIRERKQVEHEQQQAEQRYRDMLVREVHHRIKNNLQGLIGLLRNSFNDDTAAGNQPEDLVSRAISQIRTIAMVHGLQAHLHAGEVRICDITRAITDEARKIASEELQLEYHDNVSEAALVHDEEAIPLALVINEILTNAIKHIPDAISHKQVIIELKGSPVDGMDLTVFNAGGQLPKDLNTQDRNLSGVGLDLIHALLPRQYARFSLEQDQAAGGVYAKLRIEPGILKSLASPIDVSPLEQASN